MKGYRLGTTASISCPCHYPIYVALLGGTALGGVFAGYQWWILILLAVLFAGSLFGLFASMRRTNEESCRLPKEHHVSRKRREISLDTFTDDVSHTPAYPAAESRE